MSLTAGSRLGPYEVVAPLGAGGMGEVYRARDLRLKRDVAIKVLPASFSQDADRLRRFEQEARAAGVLNHPNITAVYDLGSHEGAPYIVTELLEGETLRARLSGGAIAVRKAIDYAVQVARGLAAAHEKGIVHRDLKPENLFLTNDGRVKIRKKPPPAAPSFHRLTFRRGFASSARLLPIGKPFFLRGTWDGAERPQLFSTRVESAGALRLAVPDGIIEAISRTGEMLLLHDLHFSYGYARVGTLAQAPLSGGAPRDLLEDVGEADWSPDGASLAVVRAPGWRYRLEFPAASPASQSERTFSAAHGSPSDSARRSGTITSGRTWTEPLPQQQLPLHSQ